MSFPRLKLSGDVGEKKITEIEVVYDNDTSGAKPAHLTRSSYKVKRDKRLKNVGIGVPGRHSPINYDEVRFQHSWIGYIDVLTESVSITDNSTTQDELNVALITTAVVLDKASGIDHTIASFAASGSSLGPDKPSLSGVYTRAFQQGQAWNYKVSAEASEYESVAFWLIQSISLTDNQNNTTRVTCSFETWEPWKSIPAIIDGLT